MNGFADIPYEHSSAALKKPGVLASIKVRSERDADKVSQCLARVESAARGVDNLVPPIIDAVKAHATVQEIN